MPDKASAHVKCVVTGVLFQPLLLAVGEEVAVTTGGVLSTFRVSLVEAVLPARSTAVPVITWPAPSAETTTGPVQLAMPEVASEQVKVTVTLVLFQPLALAGGSARAVIIGGSLSVPMISATMAPPGLPRTCTAISLLMPRVTGLSTMVTFWFRSLGPSTWVPFTVMVELETFSNSPSSRPPLWTRRRYEVFGLRTEKLLTIVTGAPVSRR